MIKTFRQRILPILLIITLTITMMPMGAFAYSSEELTHDHGHES